MEEANRWLGRGLISWNRGREPEITFNVRAFGRTTTAIADGRGQEDGSLSGDS